MRPCFSGPGFRGKTTLAAAPLPVLRQIRFAAPACPPCPAMISAVPGFTSMRRSKPAAPVALERAQAHYLTTCCGLKTGDRRAGLQWPGRRVERDLRGGGKRARLAAYRRQDPATDRGRRPALSVRAAESGAARLHGAEGGGDGRVAAAAGAHPPRPGGARQSRAHARQCHRGGRAMRHSGAAGDRRAGRAVALSRRARPGALAGVLR